MLYIGIDPGQTGAIACLLAHGDLLAVVDLPIVDKRVSPALLAGELARLTIDIDAEGVIAIEEVHSMPRQGVSSTFKFGQAHGIALGVAATLATLQPSWRLARPTPQAWKKHHHLIGKEKEDARALAIDLWPSSAATTFHLKTKTGRADAALIALWAKETSA